MFATIGTEEIVFLGFSRTLLTGLGDALPPKSVIVVEEPDVLVKRGIAELAAAIPSVSRVVPWEYQDLGALPGLTATEPAIKGALAVIPGIEYAVEAAAQLADQLGLPGATPRAAAVFRNKVRQREVAAAAGLRNPAYAIVDGVDAALEFFDRSGGGRCVLKPTARQASLGVLFADRRDQVAAAFRHADGADEAQLVPGRGIASQVLIETALTGPEYSCELLVGGGEVLFSNVTRKRLLGGRYPVEVGHVVPGDDGSLADALVAATTTLAKAAGFRDGILHAEWIAEDAGPALVECAARMPGDEIATLVSLAHGFSVTETYLRILLGDRPPLPDRPCGGAAITFLTSPPGVIATVEGDAEARAVPGVHVLHVTAQPGDEVHEVVSSWERLGYVIATGTTAAEASAAAEHAIGSVRIQLA